MHFDYVEGCAWTEAGDHLPFLGNESENGNETTEYSNLCRVITKTGKAWAFYVLVKITGKEVWRGWAEASSETYQPCLAEFKRREITDVIRWHYSMRPELNVVWKWRRTYQNKYIIMKEITIAVPDGKRAEWIDGVLTLVDEPKVDNRPVTERIKTFEDAYIDLGKDHPLCKQYTDIKAMAQVELPAELLAYLRLRIIVAALNEGWEPKFEKGECRYSPCFYLYTKELYDELDDEKKGRCVPCSGRGTLSYSDFANCYANYDASYSYASYGSRLSFRTRELAAYAGRQFTNEWADFMFQK